ncbi:MAG: nitroreductase family protein [Myxococcota bacterium]
MTSSLPTLDLLTRHRSIRRFTDAAVPDADVQTAVRAGQAASTSTAAQAYCAIEVTEPTVRAALVPLAGNQRMVERCGAFLVICGDTHRHRLTCSDVGQPYEAGFEALLVAAIDASLFAQNIAVAFEAMGYGVCYVGGLRNQLEDVDALLGGLPQGVYPLFGMCVGVPAEEPLPRPRLPLASVLLRDRYPDDATIRNHLAAYDQQYTDYLAARDTEAHGWTAGIVPMFAKVKRAGLAAYYKAKGARLD